MKKIWLVVVSAFVLMSANVHAGVTCTFNKVTGNFEAKNGDAKANEECKKRGVRREFEGSKPIEIPANKYSSSANLEPQEASIKPVASNYSDASKQSWVIKSSHKFIREVIEDWAEIAGYEVIWESRDFEVNFRTDKLISSGNFWDALTVIGESYRNSDSPFQVQPTAFKQIIIQPMQTIDQQDK